jgi:hypothetical protein
LLLKLQGNFHHWRPLFLHFDTYFKTYLSSRNGLSLSDNISEDDSPFPKHAVLQILRVMQIILENCHDKSSFDGLEVCIWFESCILLIGVRCSLFLSHLKMYGCWKFVCMPFYSFKSFCNVCSLISLYWWLPSAFQAPFSIHRSRGSYSYIGDSFSTC